MEVLINGNFINCSSFSCYYFSHCNTTRHYIFIHKYLGWLYIYTSGDPFTGLAYTFTWMKDVMVDDWNARFLVMTALLGVGAAFMYKTGGSNGLIRILESKLTTKRRVLFLPYIL